jgi:hypothetical protein
MLICIDSFNLKEEYRLSKSANDLEDKWELISKNNNNINNILSYYAISECSKDFKILKNNFHYPQDSSVFNLLSSLFSMQNNDIFNLLDNDVLSTFNTEMF